jgi:hypothetical protein
MVMIDDSCTCGEPPMSGHYLWCASLRGQRDSRPAQAAGMTPEELRGAARANAALAVMLNDALAGDQAALVAMCAALNAARER